MQRILGYSAIALSALAVMGCATNKSGISRTITEQEAFAFEDAQKTGWKPKVRDYDAMVPKVFAQPLNKKEDCLVPMSETYTKAPNFKSYWDGSCKDGFAYGLGRDIMRSDTAEVDAVTVYEAGARNVYGKNIYAIVFHERTVGSFAFGPAEQPYMSVMKEAITAEGFLRELVYFPTSDDTSSTTVTALLGTKYPTAFIRQKQGLNLYAINWQENSPTSAIKYDIRPVDSVKNTKSPYLSGLLKTNVFVTLSDTGGQQSSVNVPDSYRAHLERLVNDAFIGKARGEDSLIKVEQMQTRYFEKACIATETNGIPVDIYRQACKFKATLAESLNAAVSAYNTSSAEAIEQQQRKAQAAFNTLQLQAAKRAQQAANAQSLADQLSQTANELNRSATAAAQQAAQFPQPQVWQPPQKQTTTCIRTGNVVHCR